MGSNDGRIFHKVSIYMYVMEAEKINETIDARLIEENAQNLKAIEERQGRQEYSELDP